MSQVHKLSHDTFILRQKSFLSFCLIFGVSTLPVMATGFFHIMFFSIKLKQRHNVNAISDSAPFTGAVAMAIAHPEFVVGVVSHHRPTGLPPGMVVMTPGVKLLQGTDSLRQKYITPEEV